MSDLQGTNVGAPIRPFNSKDTYPVAHQNEIRGGWHSVDSITQRNAIPQDRRQELMVVAVKANGLAYQLQGGTDNIHWQEYGTLTERQLYFCIPGGLTSGVQDIELPVFLKGGIINISANLKVPGSTNTIISIQKASATNYAINSWSDIFSMNMSIPAGSKVNSPTYSLANPSVNIGDYYRLNIVNVGSGAQSLTVVLNIQEIN